MKKYIRATNDTFIFHTPTENSKVIKTLAKDEFILFNREKRRNGINWMEVYLDNGSKGYIKKNKKKDIFICEKAKLAENGAQGFTYQILNNQPLALHDIFSPVVMATANPGFTKIELRRDIDTQKGKAEYLTLQYDPNIVNVSKVNFYKNEKFYITYSDLYEKQFLEIDNFNGRKGFFLPKTNHDFLKDRWFNIVTYVLIIALCLATFIIALALGWLVMGLIFFIPAIIVAVIIAFVIKLIVLILSGIFNQIRKRF